ncbi:hypothetical protein GCM10011611_20080 [Aliidongia dinghuensis]|uniref:Lipoprotein n=1 Tax=Aliidongia dinghuensis TaxID=1867774 RepID=A0A8J2YS98_9PROT|nr:hypothetical protein [Aliidongia dinghuensis]GGF14299.1 hypothetical protein GCM10011611_20080 [Aliidongia dinghuensis]
MKRLILLVGLALSGCADPHEPLSRDFGNAVNSNIAAQVINPTPQWSGDPSTNGQRVDNAVNRYLNNKVYRPLLPLEGGKVYDHTSEQSQQQ